MIINPRFTWIFYVAIIVLAAIGIKLLVKARKKARYKDEYEQLYRDALNKIKKLKIGKIIVMTLLLTLQFLIPFVIYPTIVYIEVASPRFFSIALISNKILSLAYVSVIASHILWALYEKFYLEKKIAKNRNLEVAEKKILNKTFVTHIDAIIGSCLISTIVPLILQIYLESNILCWF